MWSYIHSNIPMKLVRLFEGKCGVQIRMGMQSIVDGVEPEDGGKAENAGSGMDGLIWNVCRKPLVHLSNVGQHTILATTKHHISITILAKHHTDQKRPPSSTIPSCQLYIKHTSNILLCVYVWRNVLLARLGLGRIDAPIHMYIPMVFVAIGESILVVCKTVVKRSTEWGIPIRDCFIANAKQVCRQIDGFRRLLLRSLYGCWHAMR